MHHTINTAVYLYILLSYEFVTPIYILNRPMICIYLVVYVVIISTFQVVLNLVCLYKENKINSVRMHHE